MIRRTYKNGFKYKYYPSLSKEFYNLLLKGEIKE